MKPHRQVERRLAAELNNDAFGMLDVNDVHHVLEGQRLEVEAVRSVVIGRDRLRVAVDHDGLKALFAQGKARMTAAVIELYPLADAIRPRPENHNLAAVGGV